MTPKISSLLTDPQPHSHIVYPCTNEALISDAVSIFASSGLSKGDAVVLVTTAARFRQIEFLLSTEGFVVDDLLSNGQLSFLEAGALLSALVEDGLPDAILFKRRVGRLVEKASLDPGTGKARKVRIFGEMVSLLYSASKVAEAERLEEFWNEMVEAHSISLFCSYSLKPGSANSCLPQSLVDSHSHDISSLELVN